MHAHKDYEQLRRVGIEDPKLFVKNWDGEELTYVFVGRPLAARVDGLVEETLAAEGYCDVKVCVCLLGMP